MSKLRDFLCNAQEYSLLADTSPAFHYCFKELSQKVSFICQKSGTKFQFEN